MFRVGQCRLRYSTTHQILPCPICRSFTHFAVFSCATALSERVSRGRRSSLFPFMSFNTELPLRRMSVSMLDRQLTNCYGYRKVASWTLITLSVGCGSFVILLLYDCRVLGPAKFVATSVTSLNYVRSRSSLATINFGEFLTLILRRSRTGTVWFYTSTSNKRAATTKTVHKVINKGLKTYVQSLHTGENFH